jgi:tRNA G18 (ribose-2'-O)-methylase SpoU
LNGPIVDSEGGAAAGGGPGIARASPIEFILDPEDPRVAPYRGLPRLDSQVPAGLFVAEGSLVVRRLLACGRFRVRSVLATEATLPLLRDLLGPGSSPLYVAQAGLLRAIAGYDFHRGCIALAEVGPPLAPEALVRPAGPRRLVVLEAVSDPDNLGAIFRNAMGLGNQGVLLSPGAADPLYRKAIRVSAGAILCLPFARLAHWPADLWRLRGAGYAVVALTPDENALDIADVGRDQPAPERMALVLGAEGPGLSTAVREGADLRVKIAMAPGLDSLNEAVASAIALYWLSRHPRPAG